MVGAKLRHVALGISLGALLACGSDFDAGSGGSTATTTTSSGGSTATGSGSGGAGATGGGGSGGTGGSLPPNDWCGPAATLTGDGVCVLASGQNWPECPVLHEGYVYWTTHGAIWRVEANGQEPAVEVTGEGTDNECMAIGADGVMWWASDDTQQIHHATTAGAAHGSIDVGLSSLYPNRVAVNATHVYVTAEGPTAGTGAILMVDKDDAVNAVVVAGARNLPAGIAVDDSGVFWIDEAGVFSCPLATPACTPTKLADHVGTSSGDDAMVLTDPTTVYWNYHDGVGRAPKILGAAESLDSGTGKTSGLAIGAGFLYFTVYDDVGSIRRVALDASSKDTLVDGIDEPLGTAVGDAAVYWVTAPSDANGAEGLVMKAQLP